MNEVTMNLKSMTPFGIGDSIRNHIRPVIAKSSQLVSKFGFKLVSSAYAVVSFPKGFLPLCVKGSGVGFYHATSDIMFV